MDFKTWVIVVLCSLGVTTMFITGVILGFKIVWTLTEPSLADVAESVDASDLKSETLKVCGFESHRPHHTNQIG